MAKRTSLLKRITTSHQALLVIGAFCILLLIASERITARNHSSEWRYTFQEEIPLSKAFPREYHSLSLDNSSIYVNVANGFTYSLNRLTGAFNWRHEEQNESIYPAAFGDAHLMFVTNFDGRLYAIDTRTGKEVWRFTTPGLFMADTEPIESGGIVYFGSRNGSLYALDEYSGSLLWNFQTTPVDSSRFMPTEAIIHFGRFVIDEKNVYINSSTDKTIYALNKKTGGVVWRFDLHGFLFQKPRIFPTSISFWDSDGTFYVIDKNSGTILYSASVSQKNVYQGATHSYIVNSDNSVDAVDMSNGSAQWKVPNNTTQPVVVKEVNKAFLAIAGADKNNILIKLIDLNTGSATWSTSMYGTKINTILSDTKQLYVLGDTTQCSFRITGERRWCITEHQIGNASFLTENGIYLISDTASQTTILYLDKQSGVRKWMYQSDNVNTNIMQEYKGMLYFVSKNNKSVFMLNSNDPRQFIQNKNIRTILDTHGGSLVRRLFTIPSVGLSQQRMVIDDPEKSIGVNSVYELTIHLDESRYVNKYDDASILGFFSNEQGKTYQVHAFYYDKNIWKLRFTPTSTGVWKWKITSQSIFQNGSFTALTSNDPGFLSISQIDPREFTITNGNIFIPIGIQDCTADMNQDGDPLNQWFLGTNVKPVSNAISFPTVSMDEYLSTYAASGFNLFRWGAGNCSFNLWKTLSPSGNRYAVNEGIHADKLFSSLRNHGYHVWMSLFSFKLPIDEPLKTTEKQEIIKRYLDYVVARYAGYVDIWELANEIKLDDSLIGFMSGYIRSIDPYHHPITTNWDRSVLPSVDLSSIHWYSQQNYVSHQGELNQKIDAYKNLQKPIVFSEQGNLYSNWDDESATRMRIRLWVGLFAKMSYIFWNTSTELIMNSNKTFQNPSNLYIGPTERHYVSVFRDFTANISSSISQHHLASSEDSVYAVDSGNKILGYIYRQIGDVTQKADTISIKILENGIIQWINPATGVILAEQPVQQGAQFLESPDFSTDIAFVISLQ